MKYLFVLLLLIGCGGGGSEKTVIDFNSSEPALLRPVNDPHYKISRISENNYYLEVESEYEYSFFVGTVGTFNENSLFNYYGDGDVFIRMYTYVDGDWVFNFEERINL